MPVPDRGEIAGSRIIRLYDLGLGHSIVPLLNQIPESCRDEEALHRICDVAEALLDPEVPDLLPTSSLASFDRWVQDEMTQRLALALVVVAVYAEVIDPTGDDTVEELRRQLLKKVRGIYSTAAEAAARAVVELDGPSAVGIPFWLLYALEDANYQPCKHLLGRVAQATAPRRRWYEGVADLGYVLFEQA